MYDVVEAGFLWKLTRHVSPTKGEEQLLPDNTDGNVRVSCSHLVLYISIVIPDLIDETQSHNYSPIMFILGLCEASDFRNTVFGRVSMDS